MILRRPTLFLLPVTQEISTPHGKASACRITFEDSRVHPKIGIRDPVSPKETGSLHSAIILAKVALLPILWVQPGSHTESNGGMRPNLRKGEQFLRIALQSPARHLDGAVKAARFSGLCTCSRGIYPPAVGSRALNYPCCPASARDEPPCQS